MDGSDRFGYDLSVPMSPEPCSPSHQYLIAGGGVSPHISEKHIALVRAQSNRISWKLSSLSILNGEICTVAWIDTITKFSQEKVSEFPKI